VTGLTTPTALFPPKLFWASPRLRFCGKRWKRSENTSQHRRITPRGIVAVIASGIQVESDAPLDTIRHLLTFMPHPPPKQTAED
jgi:hypothetical protein